MENFISLEMLSVAQSYVVRNLNNIFFHSGMSHKLTASRIEIFITSSNLYIITKYYSKD